MPQINFRVFPLSVPTFLRSIAVHSLEAKCDGEMKRSQRARRGFSGVVATTVSGGQRRCDLVRKSVERNELSPTGFPPEWRDIDRKFNLPESSRLEYRFWEEEIADHYRARSSPRSRRAPTIGSLARAGKPLHLGGQKRVRDFNSVVLQLRIMVVPFCTSADGAAACIAKTTRRPANLSRLSRWIQFR